MIVLGLDTSTPVASVALRVDERIFERAEVVTTYSERLLALIDEVFVEAGVRPRDLDGVACGAGPGSFTGLRIGLATAKGLCLGTGAPLVLVSSLEILAARAPLGSSVLAAVDAFRGEIYAGYFDVDETGRPLARAGLAAFTCKPEALASRVGTSPQVFIGDGFVKYASAIPIGATALVDPSAPAAQQVPRARELIFLAQPRIAGGLTDDPRTAAPSYVRASAPEEDRR